MKNSQVELFKNSRKEKKVSIEKIDKYRLFLIDLYNESVLNTIVNIHPLIKKHKIANINLKSIIDLKVVKRVSKGKYVWLEREPNIVLAEKLYNLTRLRASNYIKNNKNLFTKIIEKPIEKPIVETVELPIEKKIIRRPRKPQIIEVKKSTFKISLLWGMFNFNKD